MRKSKLTFRKFKLNWRFNLHNTICMLLVILGIVQILGFISGNKTITYIGKSLALAPLPRPFIDINGYENFASNITYEIFLSNNSVLIKKIRNPELSSLAGPHKRRIVYIDAIILSPVMKRYRYEDVLTYGFCNNGPLSGIMNVNGDVVKVRIHIATRTAGRKKSWIIPIDCTK